MDSKLSSVIERVQKLLALSKSSNAGEAANAAAAANKLIDQYRLSQIDLETPDAPSDYIAEDEGYVYETGRIIKWKFVLIHVLAEHYGVALFNDCYYPEGRKTSRYKLTGRTSDIQIVRYMFAWLTLECQRLSDLNAKGKGHIVVNSYCNGFVAGIEAQLKASRQEVKATATTEAIVKLDARLKESESFMYEKHKNLKTIKASSHTRIDAGAFATGRTHGQNVHLGSALNGSKVKLLKK